MLLSSIARFAARVPRQMPSRTSFDEHFPQILSNFNPNIYLGHPRMACAQQKRNYTAIPPKESKQPLLACILLGTLIGGIGIYRMSFVQDNGIDNLQTGASSELKDNCSSKLCPTMTYKVEF